MDIVIITEDSKSGYNFYTLLNKFRYGEKIKVYSSNGYKNMCNTVERLTSEKVINRNDFVVVACDQIASLEGVEVSDKRKKENREILKELKEIEKNCVEALNKVGAKSYFTTYTCWEEIPLSFSGLESYCENNLAGALLNKEQADRLKEIRDIIKGNSGLTYAELFKEELLKNICSEEKPKYTTIERIIAWDLNRLTCLSKQFNNFNISKDKMGLCWGSDCKEVRGIAKISNVNKFCDGCFVNNGGKTNGKDKAHKRFMVMVANSIGKEIIQEIDNRIRKN